MCLDKLTQQLSPKLNQLALPPEQHERIIKQLNTLAEIILDSYLAKDSASKLYD